MTTLADANPHAAAAGNWRWLTGLTRADDALHVGHRADPLPAILRLQFGRVVSLDRAGADPSAALASLPNHSFDFTLLPGVFEWWSGSARELFGTAHRLLRSDGWVALAGDRRRRPGRMEAGLARSGFRDLRAYALSPSYTLPYTVIPRTRNAALACEQDRRRQLGGHHLRIALAAAGLHDLLYSGWLVLATR